MERRVCFLLGQSGIVDSRQFVKFQKDHTARAWVLNEGGEGRGELYES